MNRPFEFRAWDKDKKELISFDKDYSYYHDYPEAFWALHRDKEITQYTGLKDKNGVKIFEGDIISHAPLGKEHYKDFREVKWQEIEDFEEAYVGFNIYPSYAKKMYVVGNIYQNPELMKG